MNRLAFACTFLAFFLQSLIPLGFMPDVRAAGGAYVTICSGYAHEIVQVDDRNQPAKPHPAAQKCPYAALAACTGAIAAPALAEISPAVLPPRPFDRSDFVLETLRVFSARGPPVSFA